MPPSEIHAYPRFEASAVHDASDVGDDFFNQFDSRGSQVNLVTKGMT